MMKFPFFGFFGFFMILSACIIPIGFFNQAFLADSPKITESTALSSSALLFSYLREMNVPNDVLPDYSEGKDIQLPFSGFIQNLGQVKDDSMLYYYSRNGLSVGFSPSTITFVCLTQEGSDVVRFALSFPGSQAVAPVGRNKKAHYINYFYRDFQLANVPTWDEIWYDDLYPGIDLRYYMSPQGFKYDFVVHPGADPNQITVQVSKSITLSIDDQTVYLQLLSQPDVRFQDSGLTVVQADGTPVPARFIPKTIRSNSYGFHLGTFDPTQLLIIDPLILGFGTYLSGSLHEEGYGITVDDAGNAYITGGT
ncbi:MAG: SBBP repeat-containing protein, partial [Candidatus Hermodarchaeota archaeon]